MVEVRGKNGLPGSFIDDNSMRVVEYNFAAFLDESAAAQERMWHMLEDGGARRIRGEVIERDQPCFDLVHASTIGDAYVDAVGDGFAVPDAGMLSSIVIARRGIDFPGDIEVAGVGAAVSAAFSAAAANSRPFGFPVSVATIEGGRQ